MRSKYDKVRDAIQGCIPGKERECAKCPYIRDGCTTHLLRDTLDTLINLKGQLDLAKAAGGGQPDE